MKEITDALIELNKRFNSKQYDFFNEHDFHNHFFSIISSNKLIAKAIHPEYPTWVSLKNTNEGYKLGGIENKRGQYDFAILSEEFIKECKDETNLLSNKTKNLRKPKLDAAIEFKYFLTNTKNIDILIKLDLTKLQLAVEAKEKYLFIFAQKDKKIIDAIAKKIRTMNQKGVNIFLNGEKL